MAVLNDPRRIVGIIFWSLAGICFALIPLGIFLRDTVFIPGGMVGAGYFTMLACMPREWFLKEVHDGGDES